jgi:hypothetical protein
MTERIAQSADGKQHVFPAGTPDDVIDRAMSEYAAQSQANAPRDFGNPTLNSIAGAMDTVVKPLETFGQKATDMMTLGGLDEITAAPGAAYDAMTTDQSFGDAYSKRLSDQEARAKALSERDPIASTAGSVTGAVTGPGAQAGMKFVQKGGSMVGRALRSLVPAAPLGATAGFLGTEGDVGDRAEGAAYGTATAMALAPVAQIGGEVLGKFLNVFRGKQTLPNVAQGTIDDPLKAAVTKQPGPTQVSAADMDAGVQRLFRALKDDGVDTERLLQMAHAGQLDDRTIAGLAGPNTRQMIDTYASMNGPGKTIVAGAQRAGQDAQSTAVKGAAEKGIGVSDDFMEFGDLLAAQKKSASPLYEAAYKANKNVASPTIDRILATPAGKKALTDAATMMQNDMTLMGVPDKELTELVNELVSLGKMEAPKSGKGVAAGLKLQSLDYVKRALDDQYDVLARAGEKTKAGIILDLKRSLVRELDAADITARAGPNSTKPEGGMYAQARKTWSGPAAMEEAADLGRSIMKDDWIGNAPKIKKMSPGEIKAFKVGALQAVDDFVGSVVKTADKAARITNLDKYLDRLRPAFDSDHAFGKFVQDLKSQSSEFQAVQMAGKGSQTAPRIADALDQGTEAAATGIRALAGDKFSMLEGGKNLLRWMGAPNANARAAAISASLGKVPDVLPYLSAVGRPSQGTAGTLLSGSVALPASQAKARADALMGRRQ